MIRYAVIALLVAAQVWVIIEAANTRSPRLMPRWSWVLLTVFVPVVSMVLWFVAGRPRRGWQRGYGPDDDPDFLRSL